ncbi:hypothetical protein QBC46DRAFT_394518 [Diplogelasinospora grovesii]|uniref:Uncharacterized protein n=1 Tax=Diplogelasinospora grovesii TaxID=303347 RepID=A0AAN6N074_9PEZI|nr:hypothetical protein QBC46DRAFT_394518 [Diplogelasinospora grovesii]
MKSYFAAPNFDCGPAGPVALGSLLSDPFDPEESLNKQPVTISDKIHTTTLCNFEETLKKQRAFGGGIWFKFLEWMMGLDISGDIDTTKERIAKFDKLETRMFRPSDDYVKTSIAAPEVQKHLTSHGMKRPLYMITAVKIAYGASVTEMEGNSWKGKLSAGLDGSPSVTSAIHGSNENSRTTRFDSSTPFVFAYRLRQVRYREGILTHEPYRDGALYGVGNEGGKDDADAKEHKTGIIFLELDEDDVTADDVGMSPFEVRGEEEEENDDDEAGLCELIVPNTGNDHS